MLLYWRGIPPPLRSTPTPPLFSLSGGRGVSRIRAGRGYPLPLHDQQAPSLLRVRRGNPPLPAEALQESQVTIPEQRGVVPPLTKRGWGTPGPKGKAGRGGGGCLMVCKGGLPPLGSLDPKRRPPSEVHRKRRSCRRSSRGDPPPHAEGGGGGGPVPDGRGTPRIVEDVERIREKQVE